MISPVLRVDLGADVGLGAVARARRLLDGVLHRRDHDHAVDRLLAGDRIGDLQELQPVGADGHFPRLLYDVDGLEPGSSSADELHVRLERKQLGDVIACFGDVVDDEDANAVAQWTPQSPTWPGLAN